LKVEITRRKEQEYSMDSFKVVSKLQTQQKPPARNLKSTIPVWLYKVFKGLSA
jgi:hypothetical protein